MDRPVEIMRHAQEPWAWQEAVAALTIALWAAAEQGRAGPDEVDPVEVLNVFPNFAVVPRDAARVQPPRYRWGCARP